MPDPAMSGFFVNNDNNNNNVPTLPDFSCCFSVV